MDVSVVIPALNEEKYIRYPMSGLEKQTFAGFETIVVDGRSEDKTRNLARRFAKVIVTDKKGVSAARNIGAAAAKGKLIIFIDSDTFPSENLIESYLSAFADRKVVAATGPIYPIENGKLLDMGYILISKYFVRISILFGKPCIVGSNFAVRASALRKSGGFDENLVTYEDWELSNRLKKYGKIRYVESAYVRTSARRVILWGMWRYFMYYLINVVMYNLFKKSMSNYKKIR
jgi:glycosyltransferase involved in cell wall biosynthesis